MTIDDLMLHADLLYRYAASRVEDRHQAEDLVQDCLLAAWEKRDSFDGRSQLSTWLVGIMKFKLLDHFRRARRVPTERAVTADDEDGDPLEDMFDARGSWKVDPNHGLDLLAVSPDEESSRNEIIRWIRSCVEKMPKRLRLLFTMREVSGVDVPSAAAAAGVTPGSAAVLLTRSRQNLRQCLQRAGIEP